MWSDFNYLFRYDFLRWYQRRRVIRLEEIHFKTFTGNCYCHLLMFDSRVFHGTIIGGSGFINGPGGCFTRVYNRVSA